MERLVELLEKLAAGNSEVQIQSPGFLSNRVTGEEREFDVLLRTSVAHHTYVTVFECRDRRVPVGGDHVESFTEKCRDCLVDGKIIVSASGFRKPALVKATHEGIRCFDIQQEEALAWILPGAFQKFERRYDDLRVTLIPQGGAKAVEGPWKLHDASGQTLSLEMLRDRLVSFLDTISWPEPGPGKIARAVRIGNMELSLLLEESNHAVPVERVLVKYFETTTVHTAQPRFKVYKSQDSSQIVAEVAEYEVDIRSMGGPVSIKLVKTGDGLSLGIFKPETNRTPQKSRRKK